MIIRPATRSDYPFIYNSWIKQTWLDQKYNKPISKQTYCREVHHIIENLLACEDTTTLVACSEEDPNFIFGYICYQQTVVPIIHYLFVKKFHRGNQIGTQLFNQVSKQDILVVTHTGNVDLDANTLYNPFLFWRHR